MFLFDLSHFMLTSLLNFGLQKERHYSVLPLIHDKLDRSADFIKIAAIGSIDLNVHMRQVLKPISDLAGQFLEGELPEEPPLRMNPTSGFDQQLLGSVVDHVILGVVVGLLHGNWRQWRQ